MASTKLKLESIKYLEKKRARLLKDIEAVDSALKILRKK